MAGSLWFQPLTEARSLHGISVCFTLAPARQAVSSLQSQPCQDQVFAGVLDLASGKVTHVHCPPPRLPVGGGQPHPSAQPAVDFAAEAQQRILDAAMGFSCWWVHRQAATPPSWRSELG